MWLVKIFDVQIYFDTLNYNGVIRIYKIPDLCKTVIGTLGQPNGKLLKDCSYFLNA